jgi:hypothetical protein
MLTYHNLSPVLNIVTLCSSEPSENKFFHISEWENSGTYLLIISLEDLGVYGNIILK